MKKFSIFNFQFSLLSALLVCFWVIFFGSVIQVDAATLYAGSGTEAVYKGQTFVVDWFINSQDAEVNILDLKLQFTPDTLEILEASFAGTVFTLQLDDIKISNEEGWVKVSAGGPGGLHGESLPVFRTVFKAKAEGSARISLDKNSSLLLNDGIGTPTELTFRPIIFVVQANNVSSIAIVSPTHPDQNKWYRERRAILEYEQKPGQVVSYSFSANPEIFPDNIPDASNSQVVYESLPDGIYYFKLNTKVNNSLWQEAGNFRIQIDLTPPEEFTPIISSDPLVFDGRPFINFAAIDKTSGILHYKVKPGPGKSYIETNSPYKLPGAVFDRTVEVMAIDNAGNIRNASVRQEGFISFTFLFIALGLGVAGLVFGLILAVHLKRRQLLEIASDMPVSPPIKIRPKAKKRSNKKV